MDRSSSTMRMRSTWLRASGLPDRGGFPAILPPQAWNRFNGSSTEGHGDDIAPPVRLDELSIAAVLPSDAGDHGESQPRPPRPVGRERNEGLVAQLGSDHVTGVVHRELPSRRRFPHRDLDAPPSHLLGGDGGPPAEDLHGGADADPLPAKPRHALGDVD